MSARPDMAMNGFDYLRLVAAALVVVHHARVLSGAPAWIIGAGPDPGALGVGVFFVISGYLVTGSLERTRGAWAFIAKRALRILPGLFVALALTAFVLGPLVGDLSAGDYFSSPAPVLYVIRNLTLYAVTYDLPGVFADAPFPDVVNGSLWSLRLEFTCYLGLAMLGAVRWVRGPMLVALVGLAAVAFVALHVTGLDGRGDLMRIAALTALNGGLFLGGAAFKVWAVRPPAWTGLVGLALLPTPFWPLGLPLAVVVLGVTAPPKLPVDLSYGLYIYSFPLQQMLAQSGHLTLASSLALTLPFAAASWFLVEKPALGLKARIVDALAPSPIATP